ncbi:MAG: hypothetical protein DHS20C09_08610 [marine bacterium B5-7]|nr:MAG: hypothetical protein DHS20C09_08610 [marine bacterium B5-7]
MYKIYNILLIVSTFLLLAACNTTTVRSTQSEPVLISGTAIPEALLLDVGVNIFDPDITDNKTEEINGYTKILEAEANYIPFKLMETIQSSGNWGVVRVIPNKQSEMDVWVDGKIVKSDGATLELDITVSDASNNQWYSKRYKQEVSKYAYDRNTNNSEPFQNLYDEIANDMLRYYKKLGAERITSIRTISQLQFAKRFSPEAFSDYIDTNNKGHLTVKRLPAKNDPLLQRIQTIRERDHLFVDTLQDYYANFNRQMEEPYLEWRRAYYEEGEALREVNSQATTRLVGGVLAVLAGILAQGSSSSISRTAGQVGIIAGGAAVVSGMNKREEAKIHVEALQEISASLDAEIEPHTVNLEERTVTLTGSVNDQYAQWQEVLREIYRTETGAI